MMADVELDTKVLDGLRRSLPGRLSKFMDGAAEEIVNDIKLSFGTGPAGRRYKRGKKGVHVASAEPGPPAVDTGALRAGMKWERKGKLTRIVSDSVEYGYYLEIGTSRMAARPFVRPVFEEWGRTKFAAAARDFLKL